MPIRPKFQRLFVLIVTLLAVAPVYAGTSQSINSAPVLQELLPVQAHIYTDSRNDVGTCPVAPDNSVTSEPPQSPNQASDITQISVITNVAPDPAQPGTLFQVTLNTPVTAFGMGDDAFEQWFFTRDHDGMERSYSLRRYQGYTQTGQFDENNQLVPGTLGAIYPASDGSVMVYVPSTNIMEFSAGTFRQPGALAQPRRLPGANGRRAAGANQLCDRFPQEGYNPAPTAFQIEDTHLFSESFYLTGLYSVVDGGFSLLTQGGSCPPDSVNGDVNMFDDASAFRLFSRVDVIPATQDTGTVVDIYTNPPPEGLYNFDNFEEMTLTVGGSDAAVAGGGVVLNAVTRRGSELGAGRYFLSSGDFIGDDQVDSEDIQPLLESFREIGLNEDGTAFRFVPPVDMGTSFRVDLSITYAATGEVQYDCLDFTLPGANVVVPPPPASELFSGELGGPILRDRLWIWGSYDLQPGESFDDLPSDMALADDPTVAVPDFSHGDIARVDVADTPAGTLFSVGLNTPPAQSVEAGAALQVGVRYTQFDGTQGQQVFVANGGWTRQGAGDTDWNIFGAEDTVGVTLDGSHLFFLVPGVPVESFSVITAARASADDTRKYDSFPDTGTQLLYEPEDGSTSAPVSDTADGEVAAPGTVSYYGYTCQWRYLSFWREDVPEGGSAGSGVRRELFSLGILNYFARLSEISDIGNATLFEGGGIRVGLLVGTDGNYVELYAPLDSTGRAPEPTRIQFNRCPLGAYLVASNAPPIAADAASSTGDGGVDPEAAGDDSVGEIGDTDESSSDEEVAQPNIYYMMRCARHNGTEFIEFWKHVEGISAERLMRIPYADFSRVHERAWRLGTEVGIASRSGVQITAQPESDFEISVPDATLQHQSRGRISANMLDLCVNRRTVWRFAYNDEFSF